MDITKIGEIPGKKAEVKEYLKKEIARQELNFADLLQKTKSTEVVDYKNMNILEFYKKYADMGFGEIIEKALDKDGKLLYYKSTGKYSKEVHYQYYDEFGNNVKFEDFDNDGKMDRIKIDKKNIIIFGMDKDDDGTIDKTAGVINNNTFEIIGDKEILSRLRAKDTYYSH